MGERWEIAKRKQGGREVNRLEARRPFGDGDLRSKRKGSITMGKTLRKIESLLEWAREHSEGITTLAFVTVSVAIFILSVAFVFS